MNAPPIGSRSATRCRVRLSCSLRIGDLELPATTIDLSEAGFAVTFGAAPALSVGAAVEFSILLGTGKRVHGMAHASWVDTANARLPLAGFRIFELAESDAEQLKGLIERHRPIVLVLDDDPDQHEVYDSLQEAFEVVRPADKPTAWQHLSDPQVSVVIAGDVVFEESALAFFSELTTRLPSATSCRLVAQGMTVAGQLATLVNEGQVFACLRKPFGAEYVRQIVRRANERYEIRAHQAQLKRELEAANAFLQSDNAHLRQRASGMPGFQRIVGSSPELVSALEQVARVHRSEVPVHLQGETGTGKELVAQALHSGGSRKGGPFVALNCAALPRDTLHSVLFGHKRGSFTGADRDHAGVFEQASGGTLFLDEIAELPLDIQATLLRALQESEVTPLGAVSPMKIDVRLISATHRDLRAETTAGRFREDLFFRVVVLSVRLPALRERTGDIPLLARHFLDLEAEAKGKDVGGFTAETMMALEKHAWPGNVRELQNEVERLVLLSSPGSKIGFELLSPHIAKRSEHVRAESATVEQQLLIPANRPFDETVEQVERLLISRALNATGNNVSAAARLLKMERTRLLKLRDRLRIGVTPD